MRYLRIIFALTLLAGTMVSCQQPRHIDRPNVLFVSIDDLNDWIGVMGGHPQARTEVGF